MAKTKTGLYVPGGRNEDWLKLKIPKFRNFVVCGYTQGTGAREDQFGALVLGLPDKDGFRYMGSAGSGFTEAGVREMLGLLRFMRTDVSPMTPGTKVPQLLSWVNPGMVVMVKYYDITKDGKLIWPIFQKIQRGARIPDEVGFDFKVV
jgi:bifunctional non-homologous end joining protein LigD